MPGDETAALRAKFEALCDKLAPAAVVEGGSPASPVLARQRAYMQSLWDAPPVAQLEIAIGKAISEDRARVLLFAPTVEEMAAYPRVLACAPLPPPPAAAGGAAGGQAEPGSEHPFFRLQTTALGLLYLEHLGSWPLTEAFIASGGLQALSDLAGHASGRVRTQALDSFLRITSHPDFDWFARVSPTSSASALHGAMLAVGSSGGAPGRSPFLDRLVALVGSGMETDADAIDKEGHSTSSGGSSRALWDLPVYPLTPLQLLAFWLSWARLMGVGGASGQGADQPPPLHLSRAMLAALKSWAALAPSSSTSSSPVSSSAPGSFAEDKAAAADLAARLHADFGRWPAAEDILEQQQQQSGAKKASDGAKSVAAAAAPAPASKAPAPAAAGGAAASVAAEKEAGNAAFRAEKWAEAEAHYSAALGACSTGGAGQDAAAAAAATTVTLRANRAAAALRLAGYGAGLTPAPGAVGATAASKRWLQQALEDCDGVLAVEASHPKALFRKAQALLGLGDAGAATAVARASLAACHIQAKAAATSSKKSPSSSSSSASAGEALRLAEQASRFITFTSALAAGGGSSVETQGGGGEKKEEAGDEEEDAIIAALLGRSDLFPSLPRHEEAAATAEVTAAAQPASLTKRVAITEEEDEDDDVQVNGYSSASHPHSGDSLLASLSLGARGDGEEGEGEEQGSRRSSSSGLSSAAAAAALLSGGMGGLERRAKPAGSVGSGSSSSGPVVDGVLSSLLGGKGSGGAAKAATSKAAGPAKKSVAALGIAGLGKSSLSDDLDDLLK